VSCQLCCIVIIQAGVQDVNISSPRNENLNLLVQIKFFNIVLNKKLKYLLVRTKFYWSWAGRLVLIMNTACVINNNQCKHKTYMDQLYDVKIKDRGSFLLYKKGGIAY
jgi:hypothetical protein